MSRACYRPDGSTSRCPAWALCLLPALAACGPRVAPERPLTASHAGDGEGTAGPAATARPAEAPDERRAPRPPPKREALLGIVCPAGASGRPVLQPLVVRRLWWSDDDDELERPLARGEARRLVVLAWDGRRAGVFTAAGATEVAGGPAALGSYAGGSPCDRPDGKPEPDCVAALHGCGLAVGALDATAPWDEAGEPALVEAGAACAAGGVLRVDLDGDGRDEGFRIAGFKDELRAPADEVDVESPDEESCTPRFAARGIDPPGDERDWRGMDLIGVVDVDGDGRRELVLAYRYGQRETWGIYTAPDSAARLELVGEVTPWPAP